MPKASPIITAFNAGEFSPLMAGRVDLKYYQNACKKLQNFIPMVQGPGRNRPGTYFVHEVKNSANRTWLVRFVFNQEQSYQIEFGDLYARFYTNHGIIESSPGVPYEIVTPFTVASLTRADGTCRLQFAQTGDVIYITSDGQFPAQKLIRLTATTFSIANLTTTGGPFLDYDPAGTITVQAAASTGTGIVLTASAAVFTANHVGAMIYIEQPTLDAILMWEPAKAIALNAVRRSDGKNYQALNAATTGAVKPVHSEGARYDGDAGVQWQFLDPGYGWALITGYTDATHVTATILSRIPNGAVSAATNRWSFGAWSPVEGYPDNVAFFRERLTFSKSLKLTFSVAGDFENMSRRDDGGIVTKDMSAVIDLTTDQADAVVWMAPFSSAFLIGTGGQEIALDELTSTDAFGPGNIKQSRQSAHGSSFAGIATVGEGVVYVQAAGRKVRDMIAAESVERRWASSDTTVLAEHATKGGLVSIAYQQEPDSVVWCAKSDGALVGFTLNREQDVRGWHPHKIGGHSDADGNPAIVECVSVIPNSGSDELWMVVRRWVNGAQKRYVEYMTAMRDPGDDPEDAFYVDCGLTFSNDINATLTPGAGADVVGTTGVVFAASAASFTAGDVGDRIHYRYSTVSVSGKRTWYKAVAEITGFTDTTHVTATIHSAWPSLAVIPALGWRITVGTISGLGHLEGETVAINGDGATLAQAVVTGGSITLSSRVSKAHIGEPIRAVLTPMPLEAGAADGTSQSKTKRISRCGIRFNETIGAKYGRDEDSQLDQIIDRSVSDPMDAPPPLFTGDKIVSWPDGYEGEAIITIVQDEPQPCTVVALMPQVTTMDDR